MVVHASKLKILGDIRSAVTVEPMLFFYFLSTVLSSTVGTNLLLHKGCDPSATEAPDLKTSPQCLMERSAQHGVSSINVWKHVIQEIMSLVFILFAGPWSDNHGRRRRPLMFVPVIGQLLCDALNIVFTLCWGVSPAVTGIAQSVVVSTTGTFHCFFIGMFAYLSDVTDETNRTMRIGFASAILPLAATLGSLVSGYLNVQLGFTGVFILLIAINVLALFLGYLFIYDTSEPYKPSGSLYKSTFNPNIVIASFKTVFSSKRVHPKRLVLLLMVIATPLTGAPFIGEISLKYLYLRNQFGFKEIDSSLFSAYTLSVMLVGTLFTLGILSRVLKMNDSMIGVIATCFDILSSVGFLLVTQIKYLYYVPPFELFRGAALSLIGSIASKCVESHELGSMNSVRMVLENLSKSIILPLYSIVYNKTLDTMPNAFFIISIFLTAPLIGIFSTTYYLTRHDTESNQTQGKDLEDKPKDLNANNSINDATKSNNVAELTRA